MSTFNLDDYARWTGETPFDFSKHSSIGCGGSAKVAFSPDTLTKLTSLFGKLQKDGVPYAVLGNLTNVLPPDEGTEQIIVRTVALQEIAEWEGGIFAQAGVGSGKLLTACKRLQRTGVEFLVGVPCTLGGALYMNAGAGGRYIAEAVEEVLVYRGGCIRRIARKDCGYDYKRSVFMENGDCILGAWLRLESSDTAHIEEKEREYQARRAHLPKGRSMGCVFKNPKEGFAGDLIERCGLKGLRIGGAKIAEEHANFIINEGGTAKDVRALITLMKNAVRAQYGVRLEEEIRYL